MATIDELQIDINAQSVKANDAIDRLITKLDRLTTSLSQVDSHKLTNFSTSISNLTDAMKGFKGANFNVKDFTKIANGLKKFESINTNNIYSTKNAMVALADGMRDLSSVNFNASGLADFASAYGKLGGKMSTAATQNLPVVAQHIGIFVKELNSIGAVTFDAQSLAELVSGIVKLGGKNATQAARNLPAMSVYVKKLVSDLNGIGAVTFDLNGLSDLTSSISKLGGKAASQAIKNIPSLAAAMKELIMTLSKAPKVSQNLIDIATALANVARTGAAGGRAANSLAKNLDTYTSSTHRARKGSFSLASAIGKMYASYWILFRAFGGIRKAIDISSSLTEVQNVVDVTFGHMSRKVEEFAQSSIKQLGMSELSVKTFASRFQAMGSAMGIDPSLIGGANKYLSGVTDGYVGLSDSMADVSLNLTKLTADMASFYNVRQEDVAKDLEAIFTGETRPLRQYGIDLTQATLAEWAMKQGLDANVKSMSQAEKTMLRYQYVLANTGAAQGDFARTAGTWANQIRILQQQFQQLASIIGGVFVNALKPLVKALNTAMSHIIAFAQTISNALGKIFGWKFEVGGGGVTQDLEGGAGAADDIAGGMQDAEQAAKKLKTHLLGIDELNVVETDTGDGGTASGGGGDAGGGGVGAAGGEWVKGESILKEFESEIDSLYELGEYIGNVLTNMLNDIDWERVYEGARNFGTGLAQFLNGLISPELFYSLGKTIAGSLNTALWSLNSFAREFDWRDFGISLAAGLNGFFDNFDFFLLADTINTWANGLLDTVIVFLEKTDWKMIGRKIGEFLSEIDFFGILSKVGKAIWLAINAAIDTWSSMFNAAPIETALFSIVAFPKILKGISTNKIVKQFRELAKSIILVGKAAAGNSAAIAALEVSFPKMSKSVNTLKNSFFAFQNTITLSGTIMNRFVAAIDVVRKSLSGIQKGAVTAIAGFAEFYVVSNVFEGLALGSENLVSGIAKITAAIAAAGTAMTLVFGFPAGAIAAGIVGLIGAIAGVSGAMDEMSNNISTEAISNALQNPGGVPISEIGNRYVELAGSIKSQFDGINQKSQELEITRKNIEDTTNSLQPYVFAVQNGAAVTDESITQMTDDFQRLLNDSKTLLDQQSVIVYQALAGSLGEAVVAAGGSIDEYIATTDKLKTDAQRQYEEISKQLSDLRTEYEETGITQEEYASRLIELIEKYNDLTGTGSEVESAIKNVNDVVSKGIDWSSVMPEDGTLNMSALNDEIETTSNAFSDAKETISLSSQEITKAIDDLIKQARLSGDEQAETELTQLLKYQEEELDRQTGIIDDLASLYTQTIQDGLINKIPELVNSIEEPDWFRKIFGATKSGDVENALNQFKTDVIDKAETSIKTNFETFGDAGEIYASDAMKNIMDGLFTFDGTASTSAWENLQGTITNNVQGAVTKGLDTAKEGISVPAADVAKNIGDGFNTGMNQVDLTKSTGKKFGESVDQAKEEWDINSPSVVAENIALDVGRGFNNGIEKIDSTSSITKWMESIKNQFSAENMSGIFSDMMLAFQQGWTEFTEWWNGVAMTDFFEISIAPNFGYEKWYMLLGEGMFSAIRNKWNEFYAMWSEELMPMWDKEQIEPYFGYQKWYELLSNGMFLAFSDNGKIFIENWKKNVEKWWKEDVEPWFKKDRWETLLKNIKITFKEQFMLVKDDVQRIMEEIFEIVKAMVDDIVEKIKDIQVAASNISTTVNPSGNGIYRPHGGNYPKVKEYKIPQYAAGGFPEDGWFRASKGEYFGNFDDGTSYIANNNQIEEGVASGVKFAVKEAVSEILAPYLAEIAQNTRDTADKDMDVTIDGRTLLEELRNRNERNGFSFT